MQTINSKKTNGCTTIINILICTFAICLLKASHVVLKIGTEVGNVWNTLNLSRHVDVVPANSPL